MTLVILSLLIVSCKTQPLATPRPTQVPLGPESQALAEEFRSAGATADFGIRLTQPFFSVGGIVLTINGEDLQVFEYPDAALVQQDADNISADANTINGESMAWIAPPHFYKRGNLMILYIGDNQDTTDLANQVLGEQFAGY